MATALRAERARREIERLPSPVDPDAFFGALLSALGRYGFEFGGACWHLTDPATGLIVWTGTEGELPGSFTAAVENEFLEEDFAKFAEISARRHPVASLVAETGGSPRRSRRFRRDLAPDGFGDELRVAFVDGFGRWGSLGLFAERPFGEAARAAAATLVPLVATALREGMALARATGEDATPGVLVLDGRDRVLQRDARADELLEGTAATGSLPGVVHVLAARARAEAGPVQGRTLTADGAWLAIDVSPLEGAEGGLAVVLRPAAPPSLLELRLRAAGLTEREREIALALLRGEDTAAIAARLHLSPWTVQDHLKAIFDKTGVRSRRAFVASWALQAAGVA